MERRNRFVSHEEAANATLTVGIFFGLMFALSGVPYPWIGFFVGAVPTFALCVWAYGNEEQLAANHDPEGEIDA